MGLTLVKVDENFKELSFLENIMKNEFPKEEYMSINDQLELQNKGEVEIFSIFDDDQIVGMTTLRTVPYMAYLLFLAIDSKYQGKGYGTKTIQKLSEIYVDKSFVVDFELVDEKANNNAQRIRRRNFYLKCGFNETGYGLSYLGVDYEIFYKNLPFKMEEFVKILNKLTIKDFNPVMFKIEKK